MPLGRVTKGKVGAMKKVLVVDDDANIRAVLEYRLKSENYAVRLAVDGLDALRQICADDFDLIILDLLLPEIDGLSVLQRIKSDPRTSDVPVIVLSALSGSSYCDRATTLGAERYIAKSGQWDASSSNSALRYTCVGGQLPLIWPLLGNYGNVMF